MSLVIQSPHRALPLITNIASAEENSRKLSTSLNLKSLQVSELQGTILADIQDLRIPSLATPQSAEPTQEQVAVVKAFLKANPLEDLAQPAGDSRRRSAAKEGKDGAPAATLHTTTDQLTINVMDIQSERAKTQLLDEQLKKAGIELLAQTSLNQQHFTSQQLYKEAGKDMGAGISNAVVSTVASSAGAVSSIRASKFHLKAHQHQKNIDAYGHIENKLNINNERLWKSKRIKFDSANVKGNPEPATSKPDVSHTDMEQQKYHHALVYEKTKIEIPQYEDLPKVTPQIAQPLPEVSRVVRPRALFVSGNSRDTSASVSMKTEEMLFDGRFKLISQSEAQAEQHLNLINEMKGHKEFLKAVDVANSKVDGTKVEHEHTLVPSAVVKIQKNNSEQKPVAEPNSASNDLLLAPLSARSVGVNKSIKPATSEPAPVAANEAKTPQLSPAQNRKSATPFAVPEELAASPLPLPGQQQVQTEVKRLYSSSDDGFAVTRKDAGATSTTPSVAVATEGEAQNRIDWKTVPLPPPPPPAPPRPPAVREKVAGFELFGRSTKATYDMLQNVRGLQGGLNAEFKDFAKTIFNSEGHLKQNWGAFLKSKAQTSQHFLRTGELHPLHFAAPETTTINNDEKTRLSISDCNLEDIAKQMERKTDSFLVAEDALLELTKNKRLNNLPERNAQEIKDNLHDVRAFRDEAELLKNEYARELRRALNSDDMSMHKPHLIGIYNRFNALKGLFMGAVNKTVRNLQQARTTIKQDIAVEQDLKVNAESRAKYLDTVSMVLFQTVANVFGHLSQVSTALAMVSAVEKAKNGQIRSDTAKEMQNSSLRSDEARAEQARKRQEELDSMAKNNEQSQKQMRGKLNSHL